ncbi:hypothetical protein [Alkalimarinus alittae]|uniref:Uncharacterized protein n=1 Tax=Alkalimarinus alittae TaxID=2961619 RepID=A0ABY6N5J5_9ALTE|nr:hypothetical protein [Alkalimarinus alittae]UZE97252.1 hypothetical protein NKI27_05745 [Alkalimarinus alittae]
MFDDLEIIYMRAYKSLGVWRIAKRLCLGYLSVPTGVTLWNVFEKEPINIAIALSMITASCIAQLVVESKVAHYESMVKLLEKKLGSAP